MELAIKILKNYHLKLMQKSANILSKSKSLIFACAIFVSCKSVDTSGCNENKKFRESFFYHIENVEKNISVSQDSSFIQSIIFISNYAPVSLNHIMNYSRTYPTGIFKQDHVGWIKWYEENKCKNIQFRDSYILPEVYQNSADDD